VTARYCARRDQENLETVVRQVVGDLPLTPSMFTQHVLVAALSPNISPESPHHTICPFHDFLCFSFFYVFSIDLAEDDYVGVPAASVVDFGVVSMEEAPVRFRGGSNR
jgi:hypothetical protein